MRIRSWLLFGGLLCGVVGAATMTLALCCIFNLIVGQCEFWLLGPFVLLPLGLGLGLIGQAAGRPALPESPESVESQVRGEREET